MAITGQQLRFQSEGWIKQLQADITAQPPKEFIGEVVDWLIFTRDPRLDFSGPNPRIWNVLSACADFCCLMEQVALNGTEESNWREYLELDRARADLAVERQKEEA